MTNFSIAYGKSNEDLGKKICDIFNSPYDLISENKFANGEINIVVNQSVRNKTIYFVCSGSYNKSNPSYSLNDNLMSIILTIDAFKRSGVANINLIIPVYPYARSDKKDHRGPISSAVVATIFNSLNVDRIITCDIHSGQIQGFFPKAFDNIYCMNTIIEYMNKNIFTDSKDNYILCSPDAGGVKRIKAYAHKLNMNYITLEKQRDYTKMNTVLESIMFGNKDDVNGKSVVIIDDIADTMGTVISASKVLQENGAKNCIIVVSHGYFSDKAIEKINSCDFITKVICTNSICQLKNIESCNKIEVIDISSLLSDVIKCIESGNSISNLFN